MEYDLVIKNARVVDGTGMPSYVADIGVRAGWITELGTVTGEARQTIDAQGRVVSPGFIDPHTHFDVQVLWDPLCTSSCYHGVTSVVLGNCSLSLAPTRPEHRDDVIGIFVQIEDMERRALQEGINWEFSSYGDYLRVLERKLGVNVGGFVGHSALRQFVMGDASSDRAATAEEIQQMRRVLRAELDDGALGFSTSSNPKHLREDGRPIPSVMASREEVLELATVLREANAGVIQLLVGWIGAVMSVEEAMAWYRAVAEASRRPTLWLKIAHYGNLPEQWTQLLAEAEKASRDGLQSYPLVSTLPRLQRFTLRKTGVFNGLPSWRRYFVEMSADERIEALRTADRAPLRFEAHEDPTPRAFSRRWDQFFVRAVRDEAHQRWIGASIADIATATHTSPVDAFLDLALAEDGYTEFETVTSGGDEAATGEIMKSPHTVVGISDAGAHCTEHAGYGYCTHLLSRWVRELGLLRLEEAVRELSFVPATVLGLHDRGLLKPGFRADLVIFDPDTVAPCEPETVYDYPAGCKRLVQRAKGVHYTIVNGQVLIEDGVHSGAYPGMVLRSTSRDVR